MHVEIALCDMSRSMAAGVFGRASSGRSTLIRFLDAPVDAAGYHALLQHRGRSSCVRAVFPASAHVSVQHLCPFGGTVRDYGVLAPFGALETFDTDINPHSSAVQPQCCARGKTFSAERESKAFALASAQSAELIFPAS